MGLCEDVDQRMMCIAERAYQKRKRSFEEAYTYLSMETMTAGFQIIIKTLNVHHVSLEKIEICGEDVGYCKGDLSRVPEGAPVSAYESVMENWLTDVRLQFGDGNEYTAEKLLSTVIPRTTDLYEFLAYLLPECISAERAYQRSQQRYSAVLAEEQEGDYTAQVERFWNEKLTKWEIASPVIMEYLNPEIQKFSDGEYLEPYRKEYKEPEYTGCLRKAFCKYLEQVEVPTQRNSCAVEKSANWFAEFVNKDGVALFMQNPGIIFHVFRSPLYYNVYNSDRNWNIVRVLSYACVKAPMPITRQSLEGDRNLFRDIIHACDTYCKQQGMAFAKEAWEALWECIQQCVECLPFEARDLFCTRYHWKKLLNVRAEPGYTVLDHWLEYRYTTQKHPKYIALWRTLENTYLDPSRKEQNKLLESIQSYKKLFIDPETELNDVELLLAEVCGKFGGNKIQAGMDKEEKENVASKFGIKRNGRRGVSAIIRSLKGDSGVNVSKLQLAEWLFLQCVCDGTQRKLLECGYLVIEAARREQNQGKA
jgi:hypothetical protein